MRATLYILAGRSAGQSFVVEDSAVIGREPSCQIRLGDKSISRRHARITWDGLQWRVEDLDSRNGIHLDMQRVREAQLADHTEFMLGEVPVRLRIESEAPAAPQPDFEFEDDFLVDAQLQLASQQEPSGELSPGIEFEEEIVLEEEIDLSCPPASAPQAGLELSRRPGGAAAAPGGSKKVVLAQEQPARGRQQVLDPRAKLLAKRSSHGFLSGDLSQQPAWVLVLLFLVVVILMLGISLLVFKTVRSFQA